MIWGKLIGVVLGNMVLGPLGAIVGLFLGHNFDKGLSQGQFGFVNAAEVQEQFFAATFRVMGHIAKSDGRVSEQEIELARQVMHQLRLDEARKRTAKEHFSEGKQADFDLDHCLKTLKHACHGQRPILQMFLEITIASAFADGSFGQGERKILENIARVLGFTSAELNALIQRFQAQQRSYRGQGQSNYDPKQQLSDAYTVLGVTASTSDKEVKRNYRKLMAQHHPDKLVAKGLPEEMMTVAKEKSQEIQSAWEVIRKHRGIR